MDEMQGLGRLHNDWMNGQSRDDCMERYDEDRYCSAVSLTKDDRKSMALTNGTLEDTMRENSVQSMIPVKSSSQIAETPAVNSGTNSSNDAAVGTATGTANAASVDDVAVAAATTTTNPTTDITNKGHEITTDAIWTSMLVQASLTVDQLALSAASRLGLKPAMLARLTLPTVLSLTTQSNRTASNQTTQSNQTAPNQTTQSNRTAPSQTILLARPTLTDNRGPMVHSTTNTTNQPSNMSSSFPSSSTLSKHPVKSSSQFCLDRLGKAVVVKPEGSTLHIHLSSPRIPTLALN